MLFNSIDFALFLPVVFILYWSLSRFHLRFQNILIVCASYLFYGWWDWRFLSLIFFSTVVDFTLGKYLKNTEKPSTRKILLWSSMLVNLGFLGFFKYYNFFLNNFISAFTFFGYNFQATTLNIVLPVGISFYTFQTMSYTIDVYKRKLEPTSNFMAFTAFVSFFPQLVAGPIERATNLLPQFYKKRKFEYHKAVDGMRQILWGLFKKVVIADGCAEYANLIFNSSDQYSGIILFLGGIFFALQIYGDFSGYSDIAIGTARLFGFNLMQNFAFPYFSRDIAEFWRRWHISLSTWFRDYLYIPLGGSKGGTWMKVRNTFVIFLVSGFWHGANWTFMAWGALNAIYFLPFMLTNKNRKNLEVVAMNKITPNIRELVGISFTFFITVISWIFFRAENITHAFSYITQMFSSAFSKNALVDVYNFVYWDLSYALPFLIIFFIIFEWFGRTGAFAIEGISNVKPKGARIGLYLLIASVIMYFSGNQETFIYFQF